MFETLVALAILMSSLCVVSVALMVSALHRPRGDIEEFARRHSAF